MIKERHIPQKKASYYVLWVNKFLSFSDSIDDKGLDRKLKQFLNQLYTQKTEEWQLHQAEEAVRLYFQHFIRKDSVIVLEKLRYVFPAANLSVDPRGGKIRRHYINSSTVQKIVKEAVKKAGIFKKATVHTLRHSFATHLLMNGANIREIQDLPEHKNIETTMIYTHVLRDMSNTPQSPLDSLYKNENYNE